jgi:hypothetical protein
MKPKYTIAQIIEELKKLPPELLVIINGYEGENENILPPNIINVKFVSDEPYIMDNFSKPLKKMKMLLK